MASRNINEINRKKKTTFRASCLMAKNDTNVSTNPVFKPMLASFSCICSFVILLIAPLIRESFMENSSPGVYPLAMSNLAFGVVFKEIFGTFEPDEDSVVCSEEKKQQHKFMVNQAKLYVIRMLIYITWQHKMNPDQGDCHNLQTFWNLKKYQLCPMPHDLH